MHKGRPHDMPEPLSVRTALQAVADLLGVEVCWLHQRRYHFVLEGELTVAVSPESAGRLRLEACRWTKPEATLWVLPDDPARLASAVRELAEHGGVEVGA